MNLIIFPLISTDQSQRCGGQTCGRVLRLILEYSDLTLLLFGSSLNKISNYIQHFLNQSYFLPLLTNKDSIFSFLNFWSFIPLSQNIILEYSSSFLIQTVNPAAGTLLPFQPYQIQLFWKVGISAPRQNIYKIWALGSIHREAPLMHTYIEI